MGKLKGRLDWNEHTFFVMARSGEVRYCHLAQPHVMEILPVSVRVSDLAICPSGNLLLKGAGANIIYKNGLGNAPYPDHFLSGTSEPSTWMIRERYKKDKRPVFAGAVKTNDQDIISPQQMSELWNSGALGGGVLTNQAKKKIAQQNQLAKQPSAPPPASYQCSTCGKADLNAGDLEVNPVTGNIWGCPKCGSKKLVARPVPVKEDVEDFQSSFLFAPQPQLIKNLKDDGSFFRWEDGRSFSYSIDLTDIFKKAGYGAGFRKKSSE